MPQRRAKVTMSDIARASGVSLSTVSLVINERPGLPPETRARVLNAARELGYTSRSAPVLPTRTGLIHTIGLLVKRGIGDIASPPNNVFFSHIIAGVEAGCRQENVALIYATLPVDENNLSLEVPRLVKDARIDGLLVVGSYVDDPLSAAMTQRGIPVVLVESYAGSGAYDSITIDDREGVFLAVQHLVARGHRHIAFLGGIPTARISFQYRREAYQDALRHAGIPITYFGSCPHNDRAAIIETTRRLLADNPQITAILCCNDEVATIAMHGVLEAGKRIPDDVSIVGFDNINGAENTFPPLTTINVDKVSMGRLAVSLLMNHAEAPDQGVVTMKVHTRLVERQSVRDLTQTLGQ
jgi:LacI family transcriptional regulator